MKLRPQYLEEGINLFKKILSDCEWTDEQLNEEKRIVQSEIIEKSQYLDVEKLADETVWKDSSLSYPILGREDVISSLTVKDLVKHKQKYFCKGNVFLVLTGALMDEQISSINEQLSTIDLSEAFSRSDVPIQKCQFNRKPDINIVTCAYDYIDVQISFDVDKKHITQNEVLFLNSVVGAGDGSILPREIREKRGLTYDIHSYVEFYESSMLLKIVFSTQKQFLYDALKEIFITLQQVKLTLTQADIDSNMPFFTENLWYWLDDCSTLNFELGCDAIYGNKLIDVEERIKINQKINCERLQEIARVIFRPTNTAITILGDVAKRKEREIKKMVLV